MYPGAHCYKTFLGHNFQNVRNKLESLFPQVFLCLTFARDKLLDDPL
jgi:hypothetical protein